MKKCIFDCSDQDYSGKRVLVRVDFNVPILDGRIGEDYRLRRAVPTIEYLSQRGARVILASHLGKPKGKEVPELSLKPVADRLLTILKVPTIRFSRDIIGKSVTKTIDHMKPGEVLLLENLRFHSGEESNNPEFCAELASLGDLYVNEAFGTMHRAHASTVGAAQRFPLRLAGFLVQKEIEVLTRLRDNPFRPFTLVVGGIKIKDKLSALKTLIPKADRVLLGGGIAYTFLAAKGVEMGDSPVEKEFFPWAKEMLDKQGEKVHLPDDHVIAMSLERRRGFQIVHGTIPGGFRGFDIGRETSLVFTHKLMSGNGTVFWNGPLGMFEVNEFADGTVDTARALALAHWRGAMTVIGGGDTIAALRKAEVLETEASHISTGGGASLSYIGGENLPAMNVLTDK